MLDVECDEFVFLYLCLLCGVDVLYESLILYIVVWYQVFVYVGCDMVCLYFQLISFCWVVDKFKFFVGLEVVMGVWVVEVLLEFGVV